MYLKSLTSCLHKVCGEKAERRLVDEMQQIIRQTELIFAAYGMGTELDVFSVSATLWK